MTRARRTILAALVAAVLVTACGGAQTASDKSNPGGPASVGDKNPPQGVSAGTGGGVATREAAGALGTPIPTPGQTGSGAGVKPAGGASPSPSPSPGGS
jgi:hypothetical protein